MKKTKEKKKAKQKQRRTGSFVRRMTWWITFTVFVVMGGVTYLVYQLSKGAMEEEAEERYQRMMGFMNERISGELYAVEVAVINTIPDVKLNLNTPEKAYDIVRRILEYNPSIVGSAIAFEPNYYPSKGRFFAPYAYRVDSTTIETKQLGNKDYVYHTKDWYSQPIETGKSSWSAPYYDSGGGEMTMTTFSIPLKDDKDHAFAVITADVSLEWLTQQMREIDENIQVDELAINEKYSSYSFIIGRNGTYIVHPDSGRILKSSFSMDAQKTKSKHDDVLVRNMMSRKQGMQELVVDSINSFIFYTPIDRTGWSMAIVVRKLTLFFMANIIGVCINIVMMFGIIVVFIVCRKTVKRVARPLVRFAETADEIARGNLHTPLPEIKSNDELARLRDSLEMMQHSLEQQMEELKSINEQKGRIEGELKVASDIQMSMLPKTYPPFPDRDDIDIYGQLTPAKAVGGDLYDFYIRDEKLFFCIGDVSGKGVPASLVMAVTRSLFRTVSAREASPDRIINHINEAMADQNDSNMFVTLFVGVLDLPLGRLRYCNAGHDAPILIGSPGVGMLPVQSNIPVGVMSGWRFIAQEIQIFPGTTLFLYTDGLTEAENADHAQFGEQRVISVASQSQTQDLQTPQQLIEQMEKAIHTFVGGAEQSDDLTMLAIQYTKEQRAERYSRSITLTNDIQRVPELASFVDEVCEAVGFDMAQTMQMNLAIEEAVVNVMTYAYPVGIVGNIDIEAQANDVRLKFCIRDNGKPFDPTAKGEVDITLNAEERPIGGLGIHLVRQIMDSINYEYVNEQNVLTLRKKLK